MNQALKNLLNSLAPFTQFELNRASGFFKSVTIKKGNFFSKAGRISDRVGFVNTGILRSFYTVNEKETTTFFLVPGLVAVAMASFTKMKPALENIQALEDSELIVIKRNDLLSLYEGNWKWQQVGRMLIENYYVRMEQRMIGLQVQPAQVRYKQFLIDFPDLIQYVPLYYIASFLGMSPETLSRIRKTI